LIAHDSLLHRIPAQLKNFYWESALLAYVCLPLGKINGYVVRQRLEKCRSSEQVVSLARYRGFPRFVGLFDIFLNQIDEEISQLVALLQRNNTTSVCEIGTAWGGTLVIWTAICDADATIISIDLPRALFGAGYPKLRTSFYRSFAKKGQNLFLLRTDSHILSTLSEVKRILGSGGLDFLFIDGDHSYEGVKRDFDMYKSLLNRGGIIALHDIVKTSDPTFGVPSFWAEIKSKYSTTEIVSDPSQGSAGIGVIYV
jgi:predicted O-methyltransferase YrrM